MDRICQTVIIDINHGRTLGGDGLLFKRLNAESLVSLRGRFGVCSCSAIQCFEICFAVPVILHILLVMIDRVLHETSRPVGVEGLVCGNGNARFRQDLLAASLFCEPAGKIIALLGRRRQFAVRLVVGDGPIGFLSLGHHAAIGIKRRGIGVRCPLGVERHCALDRIGIKIPRLGAALIGIPPAEEVAGLRGGGRCSDFIARLDRLSGDRRAALGFKGHGIVTALPVRGVVGVSGDGFRDRSPAAKDVPLAADGGNDQLCAVLVGLDDVVRAVFRLPSHGVLLAVIVDLYHGAAVGRNGLLGDGLRCEACVGLGFGGSLRVGGAGQLLRVGQLILAVELLLIVLHGVPRVGGRPPLGVEDHALAENEFGHGAHGLHPVGVGHLLVPAVEDIAGLSRVLGPCDGRALAAAKLCDRGAAHGVEADIAHALRVAPCDVEHLLNRLGGKGQWCFFPGDSHVGAFALHITARHGDGIGTGIIAEFGVGERDNESTLAAVILVDRADLAGFQIHGFHGIGGTGQSKGLDCPEGVAHVLCLVKGVHILPLTRRPERPLVGVDGWRPGELAAVEERRHELDIEIHSDFYEHCSGGIAIFRLSLRPVQMVEEIAPKLSVGAHLGGNADFVDLQRD